MTAAAWHAVPAETGSEASSGQHLWPRLGWHETHVRSAGAGAATPRFVLAPPPGRGRFAVGQGSAVNFGA